MSDKKNLIHVVWGWGGKIPGKFYYPTSIFFRLHENVISAQTNLRTLLSLTQG